MEHNAFSCPEKLGVHLEYLLHETVKVSETKITQKTILEENP